MLTTIRGRFTERYDKNIISWYVPTIHNLLIRTCGIVNKHTKQCYIKEWSFFVNTEIEVFSSEKGKRKRDILNKMKMTNTKYNILTSLSLLKTILHNIAERNSAPGMISQNSAQSFSTILIISASLTRWHGFFISISVGQAGSFEKGWTLHSTRCNYKRI